MSLEIGRSFRQEQRLLAPPKEERKSLRLGKLLPADYQARIVQGFFELELLNLQRTPEQFLRNSGFSEERIEHLREFPTSSNMPNIRIDPDQEIDSKIHHMFSGILSNAWTVVSLIPPNSEVIYPAREIPETYVGRRSDLATDVKLISGELEIYNGDDFTDHYFLHEGWSRKDYNAKKPRKLVTHERSALFIESMPDSGMILKRVDLKLPGNSQL